jgi:hypothetical protein
MNLANEIVNFLLRPAVAWCVLAGLLGELFKLHIFTHARATSPWRLRSVFAFARVTLPAQPAIAGVFLGLAWPGEIEPGTMGGTLPGAVYFAVSGALSVWGFEVLSRVAQKRYGVTPPSLIDSSGQP